MPCKGRGAAANSGDEIIAAAVMREIYSALPHANIARLTTHARLTQEQLDSTAVADRIVVGGSNLLGNPLRSWRTPTRAWRQWDLTLSDAMRINRALLLGVGWRVYESRIERSTQKLYRAALDPRGVHSVRDEYTRAKLQKLGLRHVVNTGCPTLWPFADRPVEWVSDQRSQSVLTTVTDYRADPSSDLQLHQLLKRMYDKVYLWPQGEGDVEYIGRLKTDVKVLSYGLGSLNSFLHTTDCDYVGTRLHAGIHCLNHRKRSLIIAVDNRAAEMGPETGIPTVARGELTAVRDWIQFPAATRITLNAEAIRQWRGQF